MKFEINKDPAAINRELFQITHGLYVLTSKMDGRINGQCLDACMQVTNSPPRLAIGVGKRSLTHDFITSSGLFVVNAIDREDPKCYEKVKHFGMQSGWKVDKLAVAPHELLESGVPIIPDAKAFYECRVVKEMMLDLGTHTLFVGDVISSGVSERGRPLTYNEYRETIKKGQ